MKGKKIRFVRDCDVKDHNGVVVERFAVGQVRELSEASARHWLNRGAATDALAAQEPAPETSTKSDKP